MTYHDLPPHLKDLAETNLTRKQLDVLKLWLAGYGTTRIALMLNRAEPTIRAHHTRAMQKLAHHIDPQELERIRKEAA